MDPPCYRVGQFVVSAQAGVEQVKASGRLKVAASRHVVARLALAAFARPPSSLCQNPKAEVNVAHASGGVAA